MKGVKNMNWINSIKEYRPYNNQERKDKGVILKCLDMFDDVLTRDNEVAHITSSGFVVNKARDKVLMIYHNIFDSWSWTGGHADGESDLLQVAIKEANEETGIKKINPISQDIISLDIFPVLAHIKNGNYVSSHLHLSVAYLIEADENEELIIKADENSDVKWISIDEVERYSNEPHMIGVYKKIISKIEKQSL